MEMPTHAFCLVCDAIRAIEVKPLRDRDTSRKFRGGDMLCTDCGFVIATLFYKPATARTTRLKRPRRHTKTARSRPR